MTIDGSQGEGGGQILRTALALSMCLGEPVCINRIREKRPKPGLRRQHLTCVQAAQAVCGALVEGDELGSDVVQFIPGKIKGGAYRFVIDTAGSTTLVFQTVFPALLLAEERSTIHFEGGTHNPKAPSYDFIAQAFLPTLRHVGVETDVSIKRYGFFPKGGGQWEVSLEPVATWKTMTILSSQSKPRLDVKITLANLDEHIAEREIKVLQHLLPYKIQNVEVEQVTSLSSGNVVSIRHRHKDLTEVVECLGERGLSAEKVAQRAVEAYRKYTAFEAPVGGNLTDQFLLPIVLGPGGRLITAKPSLHTRTNIDVIEQMTGKRFDVKPVKGQCVEISLS